MYMLTAFLSGILFGVGLTISNMTNPNKVLNFLDISGTWDPTLLVVMAAAVTVTLIGYQFVLKQKKPLFDDQFHLPTKKIIDKQLIIGSALFGVGWGTAGYCPGPAISALATFNMDPVYFLIGMIVGSLVCHKLYKVL